MRVIRPVMTTPYCVRTLKEENKSLRSSYQVNALLGPHPQPVFAVGAQRMDRRVQQSVPEVFRIIDAERNPVEAIQAVAVPNHMNPR